jgi:hypothetical protein
LVERDAKEIHEEKGGDHDHGQTRDGDKRVAQVAEEKEHDQCRQNGSIEQILDRAIGGGFHFNRLVASDHHIERGVSNGDFVECLLDPVRHGDGVGTTGLADAEDNRIGAIEARDLLLFFKAIADGGYVVQIDGRGALADDDVANIVNGLQIGGCPDQQLLTVVFDCATGQVDVGALEGSGYLLWSNAQGLHGLGI